MNSEERAESGTKPRGTGTKYSPFYLPMSSEFISQWKVLSEDFVAFKG